PKRKPSNPRQGNLFAAEPKRRAFWQARSYDFNVWTTNKRVEKLRYMHRNPVKRGLVATPQQWRWSSYRFYLLDEAGTVRVNEGWGKISFQAPVAWSEHWCKRSWFPPFANYAKNGAPALWRRQ